MNLFSKILLAATLMAPIAVEAQVQIQLDSKSQPIPVDAGITKGNALLQIIIPEMDLTLNDISGNVTFVGDLKKIVGGYEVMMKTDKTNKSYIGITNPANPNNKLTVELTEEDDRKFFQKLFSRNPARLNTNKKYVIRLSLVDSHDLNITPTISASQLKELSTPTYNGKWETDNNGKRMALVYLKNNTSADFNIEEQSGMIKGEPIPYRDGYLVWVTPQKKKATTLLIRSDKYKEVILSEMLTGGKQYEGELNAYGDASKAYINLASTDPCSISITNSKGKVLNYSLGNTYKRLELPYGAYTYVAKATSSTRMNESGSFVVNGKDFNKLIELLSNTALLTISTEVGNIVKLDQKMLTPSKQDGGLGYYQATAKVGYHNLTISRNGVEGLSEGISIQPGEEVRDFYRPITGTLIVEKRKGALVSIQQNGNYEVNAQEVPYTLPFALGDYYVSGTKKGFKSKDPVKVTVKPHQTVTTDVPLKHDITKFAFISYVYTPSAPIGLMIGAAKKWGGYGSLKTSGRFWQGTVSSKSEDDDSYSSWLPIKNSVSPDHWSDYDINVDELKKCEPYRVSATLGIMKSITWWLYMYVGAGYGHYKTLYKNPSPKVVKTESDEKYYADKFFSTCNIEGIEAEAGLMFRLSSVNIILGWTHLCDDIKHPFGAEKYVSELVLGIGHNF